MKVCRTTKWEKLSNQEKNNMDALCHEILKSNRYVNLLQIKLCFDGPNKYLPKPYYNEKSDNPGIVVIADYYVNFLGNPKMMKIQYRCFAEPGQAFDHDKIFQHIKRSAASIFYRGTTKGIYTRMAKIPLEPYNWS
jgi:hypothetical protein